MTGRAANFVLAAFVIFNLAYALASADRYGQSWDDPGDAAYGQVALRAYGGSRGYMQAGDRMYYGPLYFVLAGGVSRLVTWVVPSWESVDVRHLLNFLAFQLAILALYGIARRILDPAPALITALVFMYQPVLFGHGFINQKDIPLLAGFTGAVFFGLRMGDRTDDSRGKETGEVHRSPGFFRSFALGWRSVPPARRGFFVLLALVGMAISVDLIFGNVTLGWAKGSSHRRTGEAWSVSAAFSWWLRTPTRRRWRLCREAETMFQWIRVVGLLALLPAAS
jgi:4-amino-4-deoxy-L-arabinose transferase-like glycosyltransferase